jgi:hypothetical protein
MITLKFQGYSDDTFACTGRKIDVDCDNCNNGEPIHMRVTGNGGVETLIVTGHYAQGPHGGWAIAVASDGARDEDTPIPVWGMRFGRSNQPYSPALYIDAPDDVVVELIDDDGDSFEAT